MNKKIVSPIRKVKKVVTPPPAPVEEEIPEEVYEEVPEESVIEEDFKDFREYLNVFEFECILPGSGETIKFKPLTVKALKKALAYDGEITNAETLTALFDDIFKVVVLNEDFNPLDLLVFDRYALLLEIRKKTKGEKSRFETNCPKCKSQSIQEIDYDDIKMTYPKEDINFNVPLTNELSVNMKYITRRDELTTFKIVNKLKDLNKNEKEAEAAIFLEASAIDQIVTPQGPQDNISIYDKKYLLENLPQPLYQKIQNWHEENKFGPELQIELECPHCHFKSSENVTDFDFF